MIRRKYRRAEGRRKCKKKTSGKQGTEICDECRDKRRRLKENVN